MPHLTQRDNSKQPLRQTRIVSAPTTDSTNNAALFSDEEGDTVTRASQQGVGGGDGGGTEWYLTRHAVVALLSLIMFLYIPFPVLGLSVCWMIFLPAHVRKEPHWQFLYDCSVHIFFYFIVYMFGAVYILEQNYQSTSGSKRLLE